MLYQFIPVASIPLSTKEVTESTPVTSEMTLLTATGEFRVPFCGLLATLIKEF